LSGREIDSSIVASTSRTSFRPVQGDTQNTDCKELGSHDGVTDTCVKGRADASKRGGLVARVDNIAVGLQPATGRQTTSTSRGVIGPAVETALTILDISPATMDADTINIVPPLREVFAVCEGLNENIILTADTVNRLVAL